MMIEAVAFALVVGAMAGLAAMSSTMWIPALLSWLDLRRSDEPDGDYPRPIPALKTEQKRLADPKPELAATETRTAERERQISVKLRKQETALAQRERILEQSLADAERSAAEVKARIEAREAVLATQEAELQHQESELADRHRSVAERERELIRTRAVVKAAAEEGLGTVESDWWEKQLGRPLSAKE